MREVISLFGCTIKYWGQGSSEVTRVEELRGGQKNL